MVPHGRYFTFQIAEVAVPGDWIRKILRLIDALRPRPYPARSLGPLMATSGHSAQKGRMSGNSCLADIGKAGFSPTAQSLRAHV